VIQPSDIVLEEDYVIDQVGKTEITFRSDFRHKVDFTCLLANEYEAIPVQTNDQYKCLFDTVLDKDISTVPFQLFVYKQLAFSSELPVRPEAYLIDY
jgi:hypothetical protein